MDASFGVGGVQKIDYHNLSGDYANVVVPLSDGKVIAAGFGNIPGVSPTNVGGISRYNADGSLDRSFGDYGRAIAGNGPILDVMPTAGGKLLVFWTYSGGNYPSVTRLNANGSIDATYADGSSTWPGTVALTMPSGPPQFAYVAGSAALPDGRFIVAGGYAGNVVVRRYLANSQPDTTFGSGGYSTVSLSPLGLASLTSGAVTTRCVSLDSAGRIVIGVTGQAGTDWSVPKYAVTVRLNSDGAIDNTFGANGVSAAVPLANYDVRVNGLAVDSSGRPVATITSPDVSAVRWTADGKVDSSFSGDGVATLAVPNTRTAQARHITTTADGSVIVTGTDGADALLARFTPAGRVDLSFGGGDGWVNFGDAAATDVANAVIALPDGRIMSVGATSRGAYGPDNVSDFLVGRFTAAGTADPTWNGGKPVYTSGFRSGDDYGQRSFLLPDGRTLVASASHWYGTPHSLSLLNPDGTRDHSFGIDGEVIGPQGDYQSTNDFDFRNDQLVVLGGGYATWSGFFRVQRFDAAGNPDTTFGTNGTAGVVLPQNLGQLSTVSGVAILPDNRVQIVGVTSARELAVFRYTATGQLDTTFDGDGIALFPRAGALVSDVDPAIALLPDGGMMIASANANADGGTTSFLVVKLRADGLLDPAYDGDGKAIIPGPAGSGVNALGSIAVASDGSVVAGGLSQFGSGTGLTRRAAILRLLPDGTLDTAFASGLATTTFGAAGSLISDVVIAPDGRVFASGAQQTLLTSGGNSYFVSTGAAALALTADGQPDASFGPAGQYIYGATGRLTGFNDIARLPDGRLLLTGTAPGGGWNGQDVLLVRLCGDALLVNAGGPYTGVEGTNVTLSASAQNGSAAAWQWDFDYDGKTFDVDAVGQTVNAAAGDGPRTRTVAVRALDSAGIASATNATATLSATNAAPTAKFSASVPVVTLGGGDIVGFSAMADVPADVAAGFTYSFDLDNDGAFDVIHTSGATASEAGVPASYLSTVGVHTIRGRITDKDGGYSDYTASVTVQAPPTQSVTLEAESATLSGGTAKGSANGGFTGTGYADYAGLNSAAQWTVSRTAAGSATISFRYANGGTTNRPLTIYVNGTSVGTLPFAPTGGWSTWASVSVTANLIAGNNVISAVASTSNGGANVDSLTVSGGATPPSPATGMVGGFLFDDVSKDGVYQANEPRSVGKTVFIDLDADGMLDANERRVTTDANGEWNFTALPAGNYAIRPVLASGTTLSSTPINLALETGQSIGGLSIGTKTTAVPPPPPPPTGTASIAGTVFNDNNKNAKYDAGDGIGKGVVVFLDTDNDGVLDSGEKSITTDTSGKFTFTGLAASTYRVRRVFAAGQTYSTPLANITLTAGQAKAGVLIGTKKV